MDLLSFMFKTPAGHFPPIFPFDEILENVPRITTHLSFNDRLTNTLLLKVMKEWVQSVFSEAMHGFNQLLKLFTADGDEAVKLIAAKFIYLYYLL